MFARITDLVYHTWKYHQKRIFTRARY